MYPDMVAHACNHSIREAKAGGQGQPGLYGETLSQKQQQQKKIMPVFHKKVFFSSLGHIIAPLKVHFISFI
jgi:hypothetical protein